MEYISGNVTWENQMTMKKRKFGEFIFELESKELEIMECSLSEDSTEVSYYIAGYVARKILVRSKCQDCAPLTVNHTDPNKDYFNLVSRGGLIDPSQELAHLSHLHLIKLN